MFWVFRIHPNEIGARGNTADRRNCQAAKLPRKGRKLPTRSREKKFVIVPAMQRQIQRVADSSPQAGWHLHGREPIRGKESAAVRSRAKVPQVCGEAVRNVYHGTSQPLFGQPLAQR